MPHDLVKVFPPRDDEELEKIKAIVKTSYEHTVRSIYEPCKQIASISPRHAPSAQPFSQTQSKQLNGFFLPNHVILEVFYFNPSL